MNTRLKQSLEMAESCLPEEGQEKLALVVETFTANFRRDPLTDFSRAEWEELKETASEPFSGADPAEVEAFYARNGL